MVFNLDALREITDGNAEIEGQLAELFCQTADSCMDRLAALVVEDMSDQWKTVMHELKGAAANIHADRLAQLCKDGEYIGVGAVRQQALAKLQAAYAQLKPLFAALAPR
jgi:HPt (histidine-containing phosphotransfer) domain-containing protein